MDLKKLRGKIGRGEKGFTLIELLIVVAILGILAAVVILNIGAFIGSGAAESANTEAHQVATAAIAYMQQNSLTSLDDTTVGPDDFASPPNPLTDVEYFMLNPGRMQATYQLNSDGKITSASTFTGSKWSDLEWDADTGSWG